MRTVVHSERGEWEVAVARHYGAPTFTFDFIASGGYLQEPEPGRHAISCQNMTRAQLEEHVRNCQEALAEVNDGD